MATTLHSFMDIFDFCEGDNIFQLKKISIPIIQRDYAQGRLDPEVTRKRQRFIDALYNAVTQKPITLDFIYGDIDNKGNMTPLDGQQRLTTLFLLHWYAAKKDNIPQEEWSFLENFSYETRYSARDFCCDLLNFTPAFKCKVSEEIINQAWFPLDWKKDPTISSMLVMLDAIDEKFKNVANLWERLKNKAITFYFLPIKDMGLTDELYIKMNSRGKPLTQFEHFKAELERTLRAHEEGLAKRIIDQIDGKWTDLLWKYRNSNTGSPDDNIIDDEFLRYFKFICDIICYKQGKSPRSIEGDEFDLLQVYFSKNCKDALKNIETMEKFFNCWCHIPGYNSPSSFLQSFISDQHKIGKIYVDYNFDIFKDCLHLYTKQKKFTLHQTILLYAIITYLHNFNEITRKDFERRIRIVNNLIQNSEDEVSDRSDNNRIPAILDAVDSIILTGQINDNIDNNFNLDQIEEEKAKISFLDEHPEKAELLFTLEDHKMLRGQIGIIGLENIDYTNRFFALFECSWDLVDCALMSIGNYGKIEKRRGRYQYASSELISAWKNLFHKSGAVSGIDNTKKILIELLTSQETFSNDLLQHKIDVFLAQCEDKKEYPFNYYYIKYPEYRPGSYGKLWNDHNSHYLFSVLLTAAQLSQNSYIPFLKIADDKHLSKDDLGRRLVYGDEYIICTDNSYLRKKGDEILETIWIEQNEEGIDKEDRIIKLKNYLASHSLL